MAIIVANESSLQGDPTEEAIRQALAGMDLASVQDSTTASRYAVSSVDQGNVPTLVGAQIGGNTGTQGGATVNVVGRDSVQAVTMANLVTINLLNDALAPGNTFLYCTGPTGAKGWNALSGMLHQSANILLTTGADGTVTFTLGGSASGDLSGSYPNPTVAKVNGTALGATSATAGEVLLGTGTAIASTPISGDATLSGSGALALAASGVTAGSYGDATHTATFTVDAKGRLTLAGTSSIAFPVTSVFGRMGAVVPAANDYAFNQISGLVIPQGYIDGLQMIWNSATSISVTSGTAYIPALGNVLVSNATLTLSGLVLTASTWYHVYLYSNAGVPAIECVTTAPFNYYGMAYQKTGDNTRRYIGSLKTDATSQIYQFNSNDGKVYFGLINISRVLSNGNATVSTAIDISSVVPVTAISSISRWTNLSTSTTIFTQIAVGPLIYSNLPATVTSLNYVVIMDMACPGLALAYFVSAAGGAAYLDIIGYSYQR